MISLNDKKIKQIFIEIDKKCIKDAKNIDFLREFSSILNINNINITTEIIKKDDENLLLFIKCYEQILQANDYSFLKCPLCNNSDLTFHKTYERNITFAINNYIIDGTIELIVVECKCCKDNKKQHYHAILSDAILPYHLFSSAIVLNAINDKMNKIKNAIILEKYKISRQLFNEWLKIFDKYKYASSTISKSIVDKKIIIKYILNNKDEFQYQFYEQYHHPFFLNKLTCLKLAITP